HAAARPATSRALVRRWRPLHRTMSYTTPAANRPTGGVGSERATSELKASPRANRPRATPVATVPDHGSPERSRAIAIPTPTRKASTRPDHRIRKCGYPKPYSASITLPAARKAPDHPANSRGLGPGPLA